MICTQYIWLTINFISFYNRESETTPSKKEHGNRRKRKSSADQMMNMEYHVQLPHYTLRTVRTAVDSDCKYVLTVRCAGRARHVATSTRWGPRSDSRHQQHRCRQRRAVLERGSRAQTTQVDDWQRERNTASDRRQRRCQQKCHAAVDWRHWRGLSLDCVESYGSWDIAPIKRKYKPEFEVTDP